MARFFWLLAATVAAYPKPDACPSSTWTQECLPGVTCESLADARFTCSGIAAVGSCNTICAEPCCVTTTTTTRTTVTVTATTVTESVTETTVTLSATSVTNTETQTTHTSTHTGSTMTYTTSQTMTQSSTVSTTSEPAAARITVAMGVRVAEKFKSYVEDPRVLAAYEALMVDITGLDSEMISVAFQYPQPAQESGNVTVTYTITIPYEDQGSGLKPTVPIDSVQSKLSQMSLDNLNALLDKKVDEATHSGEYRQEVEQVGEQTAVNGVSRHVPLASLAVLFLLLKMD